MGGGINLRKKRGHAAKFAKYKRTTSLFIKKNEIFRTIWIFGVLLEFSNKKKYNSTKRNLRGQLLSKKYQCYTIV